VEAPPEEKEENKGGPDDEHTDMEDEVISKPDALTNTTATEAVNKGRAATDDNRGDRRKTEIKNGRDSDVADNEPKHTTEAMHRKERPNLKLTFTNNVQTTAMHRQKRKQPTSNVANLQTEGVQNNTHTQREVSSNTRKSENRQREQPLWRHGASGRHMYGTR